MALTWPIVPGVSLPVVPDPDGGEGVWERLHVWTLQETPGRTLASSDQLAGDNGVPLTVALKDANGAVASGAGGLSLVYTGSGTVSLTAPLADLLGRAWSPADTVAMLFEVDPSVIAGDVPSVFGMLLDQPTPATFNEVYQAGYIFNGSHRAWAQWFNTSGVFQTSVNTAGTVGAAFNLSGGIFSQYSQQGILLADGAIPGSGVADLAPLATRSPSQAGASIAATPNHAGLWLNANRSGTFGVVRNAAFYIWRS